MNTIFKLMVSLVLTVTTFGSFSQEIIGQHFLRNTQVVEIKDNTQDRTYRLSIQTPYGYAAGVEKGLTYPAMYITDMAYSFPIIEGWMDPATWGNTVKRHVLVGISWEVNSSSRDSRTYDYTPIVDEEWKYATGGADGHLRFIREEVFRYIEGNYSTDSKNRTFVGSSLGGLFGAYALLTQPDLFSNYILISPSLWYDDGYMFRLEASDKIVQPKRPTKVFISAGELETPEDAGIRNNLFTDAQKFTAKIETWKNQNVSIKFYPVADAFHSMTFPESIVRAIYWMHKKENE